MRLSEAEMNNHVKWQEKGYILPRFDRKQIRKQTEQFPAWIHFGGGNIFRAFLAELAQELLDQGKSDTGVIVASGRKSIQEVYKPSDNLCISVTLKDDQTVVKKVIGSVTESRIVEANGEDWERLCEIFAADSLQMASFTITEKAYKVTDREGVYLPEVREDFERGPDCPGSYMGRIAALCLERYRKGAHPLAMVSMDNYSHNGEQLHQSIRVFAENWEKTGKAEVGFTAYVDDSGKLSFPWTMIDKITPGPSEFVREMLKSDGLDGLEAIHTERKTNTAVFVNAEETGYLVVEDAFPNGRPALEEAGVIFTDRETVDQAEKMKVCTCLNPLHSTLAIFGCLLGYHYIWEEMRDPLLAAFIRKLGYEEELPAALYPGILDPKEFMDTVLEKRFSNPFVPDTPQRIAIDLSQKIPIRFGKTLEAYQNRPDLEIDSLIYIPFVLAGYLRYLMGIDDEGREMPVSEDPRREELQGYLSGIKLGKQRLPEGALRPVLSRREIFGVDPYETGMGRKIEQDFERLIQEPGAVRKAMEDKIKD